MNVDSSIQPFEAPLEALEKLLSQYENRWVLIGGIAVSLLGQPRFTDDLDALVLLSVEEIRSFIREAEKVGIEPRIPQIEAFAQKNRVLLLQHTKSATNIDISLGILPFEHEVIEGKFEYPLNDQTTVQLPTPEDLIILKSVANRPKDWEDIRIIMKKYPNLEKSRIKLWVKAFADALETPEIWNELAKILT